MLRISPLQQASIDALDRTGLYARVTAQDPYSMALYCEFDDPKALSWERPLCGIISPNGETHPE